MATASQPTRRGAQAPGKTLNRRSFLEFLGKGVAGYVVVPGLLSGFVQRTVDKAAAAFRIKPLAPSPADDLLLADGLNYQVLIRWNDPLNFTERFGFNNDFTCFVPFDAANTGDGLLWVNHEYVDGRFVSGWDGRSPKTREQVTEEQLAVGGSILRVVRQGGPGSAWQVVPADPYNRRVSGRTEIPFAWPEPIAGSDRAIGTLANCSGGLTPWGTVLTCEENYDQFYGELDPASGLPTPVDGDQGWIGHDPFRPEHYGWVVEVDPRTGQAVKHPGLGRCAHECATVAQLPDGRVVVYTGDDANDEHLYKFIGSQPGSLREGTLYVANLEAGRWEALDYSRPELNRVFASKTDMLIHTRRAAKLVGATALDRPEDIEIDPINGHVLVALTNNYRRGNVYGSLLKLEEEGGDHEALRFRAETYLAGGPDTGFACPDNMAFDPRGNLWFTSDISGSQLNKGPYAALGNNGLYVVPRSGEQAGQVLQVASAPVHAELTGPWFSPDGRSLFLSVQHPGEYSESADQPASHWPDGGNSAPRPSVVVVSGPLLDALSAVG
jgi:secreted PhoX family phosphatase